jgi:hypothetical protein
MRVHSKLANCYFSGQKELFIALAAFKVTSPHNAEIASPQRPK